LVRQPVSSCGGVLAIGANRNARILAGGEFEGTNCLMPVPATVTAPTNESFFRRSCCDAFVTRVFAAVSAFWLINMTQRTQYIISMVGALLPPSARKRSDFENPSESASRLGLASSLAVAQLVNIMMIGPWTTVTGMCLHSPVWAGTLVHPSFLKAPGACCHVRRRCPASN
jgi:hypothetical protein